VLYRTLHRFVVARCGFRVNIDDDAGH